MLTLNGIRRGAKTARIHEFLRHHGSTLMGQGLLLGLGVLTGILAARVLGPAGRGEFAAITIWPMTLASILCLGFNQAIAFHLGRRTYTISEVVTATFVGVLIQSALCVAAYLLIAHFAFRSYSAEARSLGILFVVLIPVYFLCGYTGNFFQGAQDLLRFNMIRVTTPITYAIGLVAIYLTRTGSLRAVVFSQLLSFAATVALGIGLMWRFLRPKFAWNARVIPSLFNYGYRTQATNLANFFNQRIDQLFLSVIVPPQQLGFYAVAVTLSTTVNVFPAAAGIVTFSRGSSQHSDDARATIGESFRTSLLWLAASCVALYALTPFLIHLVFGAAFSGSILACRILLPGSVMLGLNAVLYNGSSALGRPGLPSCAEALSMIVTAVGLYFLVPRYGYIGAAIVSSVAYTFSFVVMLILGHRLLGLTLKTLFFGSRPESRPQMQTE